MSKTKPDLLAPPNTKRAVPSFDALRTDDDDRNELRRNQTVPIPLRLREELAAHELPSLPPEHLRSTDDMDDVSRRLQQGSGRPVQEATAAVRPWKWPVLLMLTILATAIGLYTSRKRDRENTPSKAADQAVSSQQMTKDPRAALANEPTPLPVERATAGAPTASSMSTDTAPEGSATRPRVKVKNGNARGAAPKNNDPEMDPSQLMYNPK